jgi:hypothetical protein
MICFMADLLPEQVTDRAANTRLTLIAFFEYNIIYKNNY